MYRNTVHFEHEKGKLQWATHSRQKRRAITPHIRLSQQNNTHVLHTISAAAIHTSFPRLKLPSTKRLHPTRFFVKASTQDCILGTRGRAVRASIEVG